MKKISTSILSLCVLGSMFPVATASAAVFDYPSFTDTTGLTLVGSASIGSGISLLNPSLGSQKGAMWYTAEKVGVAGGFTTTFKFRASDRNWVGSDGFAFVIQNSAPTAIGGDGGALGYATNPYYGQAGIANSLGVEFDMWNNTGGWADTDYAHHVSVQSRGILENSPDTAYSFGNAPISELNDGGLHTITVDYSGNQMRITIDGVQTLQTTVNLSTLLALDEGRAWIGFTASTGAPQGSQSHRIEAWSFNNNIPTPGAGALALAGGLLAFRRRRNA